MVRSVILLGSLVEFRVDEDHTFVLESQELGQKAKLSIELLQEAINFALLDLNDETFRPLDALSRDDKISTLDKVCRLEYDSSKT